MKVDEQILRKGLELVAKGGSWDWDAARGGLVIMDDKGKAVTDKELVNIETFLALRDGGYISSSESDMRYHAHPVFHPSFRFPVRVHKITEKGERYLEETKSA